MSLLQTNPSESFKLNINNELFNRYIIKNLSFKNKIILNNSIVIIILIKMKL